MNPERRASIVAILEESGKAFREAVGSAGTERLTKRPGPEAWSVLEIVDHVAVAEQGMFRMLQAAQPATSSLENPEKEARTLARAGSRERRVRAPEGAHPKGRFADLEEAASKFEAAREQTIRFARETEKDLFLVSAQHPLFGAVSGYELLLIMAGHARRHAEQIREIAEGNEKAPAG